MHLTLCLLTFAAFILQSFSFQLGFPGGGPINPPSRPRPGGGGGGMSEWGSWSPWSPCTRTCEGGQQARARRCKGGIGACPGGTQGSQQLRNCNTHSCCRERPYLTPWTAWSNCPVTCGDGYQFRVRKCENSKCPEQICDGPLQVYKNCSMGCCPVDPVLEEWGEWSSCAGGCGGGTRRRRRQCVIDSCERSPQVCLEDTEESEQCGRGCCSGTPSWSEWSDSTCSVTCGQGVVRRTRQCNNEGYCPVGRGRKKRKPECQGHSAETSTCDRGCCSANTWRHWSQWSDCSTTCGPGSQTRTRTCDLQCVNDPPCVGLPSESRGCEVKKCEACRRGKPSWTEWMESECSVTCGKGTITRTRVCSSEGLCPSKGKKAKKCKGNSQETVSCDAGCCSVSSWRQWSDWSPCSADCGSGSQYRERVCDRPCSDSPPCGGASRETRQCEGGACCTGDGYWGSWSGWGPCSKSCGGGTSSRTRNCVVPCADSKPCVGPDTETKTCNTKCCPKDKKGYWGGWSSWSECSASCGGGKTERTRECIRPCPESKNCKKGKSKEEKSCNTAACSVCKDDTWSEWGSYGSCSVTCGGGTRRRVRTCVKTCADGRPCPGSNSDTTACETQCCPTSEWSVWYSWSKCCRRQQHRQRHCQATGSCPNSNPLCVTSNGQRQADETEGRSCGSNRKCK